MSKKDILDMLSRDLCLCLLVDWMGQIRKSGSLERKGGERAMVILRFQGGSHCMCRLRNAPFWPRWTSFDLY
jgi:hypothetical protein